MNNVNYQSNLTVKCGKVTDSIEHLKSLCEAEAAKLATTIEIPEQSVVSVPFWTSDIPELICTGIFSKDIKGTIRFELDFSESTL